MSEISKVAVIGASGNLGKPVTAALHEAGFEVTIITRTESTTEHPKDIPVIRTEYTLSALTQAFAGQDAVVCVVGIPGVPLQSLFVDAAEAAGVQRFVLDDFAWGDTEANIRDLDEFQTPRRVGWDHAKARAIANPAFTWTGISTGNPIDRAIKVFPLMGFDVAKRTAIIYDDGTEKFTGTTLAGIAQAVIGVLRNPEQTANRFVKVFSILASQNELLAAFEQAEGAKWSVQHNTTQTLLQTGRAKREAGTTGWILDLVVAQLYDDKSGRSKVAKSREETDSELLGVASETPLDVVRKVLAAQQDSVTPVF